MSFKSDICFGTMSGKPITSYENEEEALDAVNYIKDNYKNTVPMVSYKCTKCGFYHLSPKSRKSEIEQCGCKDSNGDNKQLFDTKKAAKIKADKFRRRHGIQLFVYSCPNSDGFHLSEEDPEAL